MRAEAGSLMHTGCFRVLLMGTHVTLSSMAVMFLWPDRKLLHCPGPNLSFLVRTPETQSLKEDSFFFFFNLFFGYIGSSLLRTGFL